MCRWHFAVRIVSICCCCVAVAWRNVTWHLNLWLEPPTYKLARKNLVKCRKTKGKQYDSQPASHPIKKSVVSPIVVSNGATTADFSGVEKRRISFVLLLLRLAFNRRQEQWEEGKKKAHDNDSIDAANVRFQHVCRNYAEKKKNMCAAVIYQYFPSLPVIWIINLFAVRFVCVMWELGYQFPRTLSRVRSVARKSARNLEKFAI